MFGSSMCQAKVNKQYPVKSIGFQGTFINHQGWKEVVRKYEQKLDNNKNLLCILMKTSILIVVVGGGESELKNFFSFVIFFPGNHHLSCSYSDRKFYRIILNSFVLIIITNCQIE